MNKYNVLSAEVELDVRFNEVDMLQIVWHGHYVQYLEEARMSFGLKYGLGYMDVYKEGFTIPIVKLNVSYKSALKFLDSIVVQVVYEPTEAAKIAFQYKIVNRKTKQLIATAETVQVFVDANGDLSIISPEFYNAWKGKWL